MFSSFRKHAANDAKLLSECTRCDGKDILVPYRERFLKFSTIQLLRGDCRFIQICYHHASNSLGSYLLRSLAKEQNLLSVSMGKLLDFYKTPSGQKSS